VLEAELVADLADQRQPRRDPVAGASAGADDEAAGVLGDAEALRAARGATPMLTFGCTWMPR
jgi:hypothetical protein